ncbi:MAG: hypothetical protein JRJ39_17655 [Deltaproteobacteria bacterium]|nr:hypothetical protein [Deltaproteobacteria bacterium]
MKKIILIGGVVIVLAVAGGAYYFLTQLNAIVERQIEKIGSQITGTKVSVSSVDIKLREGSGAINGLVIANPSGYRSDYAFRMDKILLDIDPKSVLKDPIVIDEILIDSPIAISEFTEAAKSNILEIKNNATSGKKKKIEPSSSKDSKDGKQIRLRIKKLTIKGVTIELDTEALGGKKETETLPAIYKTNLGGQRGATPEKIGEEIIIALTTKIAQAALEKQADKYKEKLKEKAEKEVKKYKLTANILNAKY